MSSLILSIISIALVSFLMLGGVSHLSTFSLARYWITSETRSGFAALSGSYHAYRIANNQIPPTAANWNTVLIPDYTDMPVTESGLSWSYGQTNGDWFCLSGSIENAAVYKGLEIAIKKMSSDIAVLGTACGSLTTTSPPVSYPDTIFLTYQTYGG